MMASTEKCVSLRKADCRTEHRPVSKKGTQLAIKTSVSSATRNVMSATNPANRCGS
jgi:hypothetical protein